ncbi:hypothetical protein [Pseudomonas sp. SMN5]|uniref:hypothetical protein n=1 Tax=Pseudomonas sp. SMN5 TaxID=3390198 RepID=UPI003F869F24
MQARILRGRSNPADSNNSKKRLTYCQSLPVMAQILSAFVTSKKLTERMFHPPKKGATSER